MRSTDAKDLAKSRLFSHYCYSMIIERISSKMRATACLLVLIVGSLSFPLTGVGAVTALSVDANPDLSDWMAAIPDGTQASELSLPGTHDSAASMSGLGAVISPWVETQSQTIKDQLVAGVRALDIRVTPDGAIAHGAYELSGFCDDEVGSDCASLQHLVREVAEFLEDHPSEAVFMRIQENCPDSQACDSGRTRTAIVNAVNNSPGSFWLDPRGTSDAVDDVDLADLRGKIALLDDPYSFDMGATVSASRLAVNARSHNLYWKAAERSDPWAERQSLYDDGFQHVAAASTGLRETWFANSTFPTRNPTNWADFLNPLLLDSLLTSQLSNTGLVFVDFPDSPLLATVVAHNFRLANDAAEYATVWTEVTRVLGEHETSSRLFSFLADITGRHGFADTPIAGWRGDSVWWLHQQSITNGCLPAAFCPEEPMAREQQITFLHRYMGSPTVGANNPFSDVERGRYFSEAIDWAHDRGITTGYAGTDRFGTGDPVTRAQAVTMLWRLVNEPSPFGTNPFTDVPEGTFYTDAVIWAYENGITTGTSATTFHPSDDVTRVQFAAFLFRFANANS